MLEITLQNDVDEIMVNLDTSTGKLLGLYVYNDCSVELGYNPITDKGYPLVTKAWKSQGNSLFLHCPKERQVNTFRRILKHIDTVLIGCDTVADSPEVQALLAAVSRYKIDYPRDLFA